MGLGGWIDHEWGSAWGTAPRKNLDFRLRMLYHHFFLLRLKFGLGLLQRLKFSPSPLFAKQEVYINHSQLLYFTCRKMHIHMHRCGTQTVSHGDMLPLFFGSIQWVPFMAYNLESAYTMWHVANHWWASKEVNACTSQPRLIWTRCPKLIRIWEKLRDH